MPRSTLNSNGMNTGSNYQFGDKMIAPNAPRSAFDWSNQLIRNIQQAGQVLPIACYEVLPNSDYTITINSLVKVLPQVVPLMSRQRIYTYAFYSRYSDLWDKWQTFMTKGYSGNEILFNPRELRTVGLTDSQMDAIATNPLYTGATSANKPKIKPHSLGDYLGLPVNRVIPDTHLTLAMQEMMYLRIWRDYFCNRNYYYDDKRILPDDDSRFRLTNSSADTAGDVSVGSFIDADDCLIYADKKGMFSAGYDDTNDKWVSSKGMQYIDLSSSITVGSKSYDKLFVVSPFYHDYPDDYFVSALPWAQRGDTSVANGTALDMTSGIEFSNGALSYADSVTLDNLIKGAFANTGPSAPGSAFDQIGIGYVGLQQNMDYTLKAGKINEWTSEYDGSSLYWSNPKLSPNGQYYTDGVVTNLNNDFGNWLKSNVIKASVTGDVTSSSGNFLTLEKLRELAVNQTIQEKMARTDGSYGEFGLTFYGERSKSAFDYRPVFIGGNTQSIIFTEVLQTSSSTTDSPLGTYAGHGVSSENQGYIGRVHTDDYGFIMLLACVMPDVYYTQGLDRQFFRELQSDFYLPERAQLGMRPILNKELFVQASTVVDDDGNEVNEGLWAYQDIFDEFRYKNNRVAGDMALDSDTTPGASFNPYTQFRHFDQLFNYGQNFARADDVRTDYLSAPSETPYIVTFDFNIRCVEPLTYRARPASIVSM